MAAATLPLVTPDATEPRLPGLLDIDEPALCSWLEAHGERPLRARQLRRALLVRGADSFEQMTDLPRALRVRLAESFVLLSSRVSRHLRSADDTHKLLVELRDGKQVECVLIQDAGRRTACVSTQVGCGMGCVFCASGLNGVERNLTPGEILEQLIRLRAQGVGSGEIGSGTPCLPTPYSLPHYSLPAQRLTHVVVMGMGEPLANLDNLLEALDTVIAPDGLGIGARHITISTVGLPAKIRRLAESGKQYHLAVSLHAPNDALRNQIVPPNANVGLDAILAAADEFFAITGRQVTYEYVLLRGINDDVSHARELARLLAGRKAHVNLIPFNDVSGLPYRPPASEAVSAFAEVLRRHGVSVKVRKRKGAEIDAACGQLRRSALSRV
jgi:23S rRNA (adenine2503-C2)-methyltransferase